MTEDQAARNIELVVDPHADCLLEAERNRDANPGFADLRNQLGMLYLEEGQTAEAQTEFEAALEINPDYQLAQVHYLVARRLNSGDFDESTWNSLMDSASFEEPMTQLWESWRLSQKGDLRGALECLENLGRQEPRFAALAAYHRAVRSVGLGDARAIEVALNEAAESHPIYRRILTERGWVGSQSGRTVGAWSQELLGEHGEAKTWCPSTGPVYAELGTRCASEGALEQARSFYDDAFLREGDESLYQLRVSRVALASGDEDEAVRCLRRAIEVDPTSVDARIALGWEYQSQGYHDEALVQFEVAARLRPKYPDVQYNLGLLYEGQGRPRDARTCFERALEVNPRYFQARASLAQLLIHTGENAEALYALKQLESLGVRSADLLVQKAEAHMALEQTDPAIRELEKAVEMNPHYPRTYYILGQAYRNKGWKRKAQEAWKQHLERTRQWKEEQPYLEEGDWSP